MKTNYDDDMISDVNAVRTASLTSMVKYNFVFIINSSVESLLVPTIG